MMKKFLIAAATTFALMIPSVAIAQTPKDPTGNPKMDKGLKDQKAIKEGKKPMTSTPGQSNLEKKVAEKVKEAKEKAQAEKNSGSK